MIQYQTTSGKTPREIAVGMYLGILSRFPTEAESKAVENYFQIRQSGPTRSHGGPGMGADEQRRISLPALNYADDSM